MTTITKETLDTPFSQLIEEAENNETPREFIRNSEAEFGMDEVDIENMNTKQLNEYIEWLDYLWNK